MIAGALKLLKTKPLSSTNMKNEFKIGGHRHFFFSIENE